MGKQSLPIKRVKERSIMEAKQKVDQWRRLFKNGEIDENGKIIKYSLMKAAEKVGVPKKSLEDYRYLLRKAQFLVDLNRFGDKRMGYLRLILKQQQQIQKQSLQGQYQTFADEKYQRQKLEQQIIFEDMIVEGETIKQSRDDEYFDHSNCIQLPQITIQQQEEIHENNDDIPNPEYGCQKLDHQYQIE